MKIKHPIPVFVCFALLILGCFTWIDNQSRRQLDKTRTEIAVSIKQLTESKVRPDQLIQNAPLNTKTALDRLQASETALQKILKKDAIINILQAISYILLTASLIYLLHRKRKNAEKGIGDQFDLFLEDYGIIRFSTDPSGKFTKVNSAAEQFTGYVINELTNNHFSQLLPPGFSSNIKKLPTELPIITKTGEKKWIELTGSISYQNNLTTGFQGIAKDITRSKNAEIALEKLQEEKKETDFRVQTLIDHSSAIIFIKDLEGKYMMANKKFKDTFLPGMEILGKSDYELVNSEKATRYAEEDQRVINSGLPLETEETTSISGQTCNMHLFKAPLYNVKGDLCGTIGITRDTTEKILSDLQLAETKKQTIQAQKLQEEFLANMSHEIRTPMNGILGMANLLLQSELKNDQQHFVQIIKQSSTNLLFLINDILDLSRIRAGKMVIESIEFNVRDIVETVLEPLRINMKEKDLELISVIDPSIPERVTGDPYRLNQILTNLLGNAVKFTHKGNISFKLSAITINERLNLQFSVKDTGIGIPANKMEYIFESFAQASKETSRKYGGTGLGLAITKQLVDLQQGTITVTSIEGIGTSFVFSIPYLEAQKTIVKEIPREKPFACRESFIGKKILIVEDNRINQMVISFTLKQAGILSDIACNGKEAVDMLEQHPGKLYDLIIMDLQMPEMDGFETTRYIRKNLHLQVPVVAMTASTLQNERVKCLEAGMDEYMSKPFVPADLLNILDRLLVIPAVKPEVLKYDMVHFKN